MPIVSDDISGYLPFLRLTSKVPGDVLFIERLSGVEGISQAFSFQLDLVSGEVVKPEDVLRKPMLVEMLVTGKETRYFHGIVSQFAAVGFTVPPDVSGGAMTYMYRAEIVPWLWFLTLSRESRTFQEMAAPDIIEDVFKRLGFSDYEFRLRRPHPDKRTFCVQYRESHFDFVSRLMEEEGIFYFFEHTKEKHTLVLCDESSGSSKVPGPEDLQYNTEEHTGDNVVHRLAQEHRVHPGKVTLRDYDFTKPRTKLDKHEGQADEEVYDYPGGFHEADAGGRRARLLLEAEEAERQRVQGSSNAPGLQPGHHFSLEAHLPHVNGKYYLTQVQHSARQGSLRAMPGGSDEKQYHNEFQAIPEATPYRPRRRTHKPVITGTQSALVVGKAGEEVWTDEYGRIKVHFYWDRVSAQDEKSSCWVRVSTPWASNGWGAISIPRMGSEVLVAFEEGDPDRPIVIGSVYNADQMPPYALPARKIHSGVKSRSSKGGSPQNFNEIRMEDTSDSELLYIQAEKDKKVVVKNNRTETVGADESITITGNRNESVGEDETISIGGSRSESVAKNEKVDIAQNRGHSIGGNDSLDVSKNGTVTIGGNLSTTVSKNSTLTISETWTVTVKKDHKEKVSNNFALEAKKILIEGKDEIEIKSGSASIILKKSGDIQIKGGKINVKGSGDVVIKGSKIGEN